MQVLRVARVRKGSREVVTLHVETTTPRRRTLQTSYERQCTPSAEQYDEWRKRTKAESSARNRAMCRLDATRHDAYRAKERERKRGAPKRERVQETAATSISLPAWKVRELDAWKQREAERLQKEAEAIAPQIARREAAGYKRIRLGPRGWCDVGGWIWQHPQGQLVDLSRIWMDDDSSIQPSWLWRKGYACGICACEECGITQHPCACEHPDPKRANWGALRYGMCVPSEWGCAGWPAGAS